MSLSPVVVALPTSDRQISYVFYRDGLGFEPTGELGDDGVPEPLQFILNDGMRLMLIPTGGFGWVTGNGEVAARGVSECIVTLPFEDQAGVDELVRRARDAGADVIIEPGQQPWGYVSTFADPDGHKWMARC
ncbi:MAG TPA: VOC family protein [Mycobacteriales bacterium]|jgi:hypothetical protein|nr:VOC family protein [Mycobacteriales bacterium]